MKDRAGVLRTVRLQTGFQYAFFVNAAGQLVASETDPNDAEMCCELLDGTDDSVATWGSDMPTRLQKMYSHWYCRSYGAIVLRPRLFNHRGVHFLLVSLRAPTWRRDFGVRNFASTDGWLSCCVPDHQAQVNWPQLLAQLNTMDQLVLPTASKILHALHKFETQPGLVHAYYAAPHGTLAFELPRFDLRFELDDDEASKYTGRFRSCNFIGFVLSGRQQLPDTLHDFRGYLVLENGQDTLLITPAGDVKRRDDSVFVSGPSSCDAERRFHVYEQHPRFQTLEPKAGPTAINARLQLAALYAASGTEVPEARSKQTGGEVAMELVRQSWTSSPMTLDETRQLKSIPTFGQLTPALPLVCYEIDSCSHELHCLWPSSKPKTALEACDCDSATEYTQRKQRSQLNSRALLTADEERRVLGRMVSVRRCGTLPLTGSLDVPHFTSSAADITEIEQALRAMLIHEAPPEPRDFPLSDSHNNELGRSLAADLAESWQAYQRCPAVRLASELKELEKSLFMLHRRTLASRTRAEKFLLLYVDRIPGSAGWHAPAFVIRRAVNLEPHVTLRDLARAAWQPDELWQFNPFLSTAAVRDVLHPIILEWLELCVLEDKLKRMMNLAEQRNAQELERELNDIGREWKLRDHPQWLVFEVEQRLQIRRVQFRVASFLIENPGAITQLNMGEGKTRVILPMLVLHMAQSDRLVRLHFLSQLLFEAYHYLHRHLTASLMCRRLLLLPFHRDVKLTLKDIEKMHDSLMRCMLARGAICVAPEHRYAFDARTHLLTQPDCSSPHLYSYSLLLAGSHSTSSGMSCGLPAQRSSSQVSRVLTSYLTATCSMRATRFCITGISSSTLGVRTSCCPTVKIAGWLCRRCCESSNVHQTSRRCCKRLTLRSACPTRNVVRPPSMSCAFYPVLHLTACVLLFLPRLHSVFSTSHPTKCDGSTTMHCATAS